NALRHSAAGRSTAELLRRRTVDGDPALVLSVAHTASGGAGPHAPCAHDNGLTRLAERLHRAGGTLEAGPTGHGFRLVARAPLAGPDADPAPSAADVGSRA